mgnify:FL=1
MEIHNQNKNISLWQPRLGLMNMSKCIMLMTAIFVVSGVFTSKVFAYNVYQTYDKVKFESSEVYKSQKVFLSANLSKPDGEGPFPTVVMMHGCGGWQPAVRTTLSSYRDFLVKNGFAVLNLDSFGPRRNSGGEVCASFKKLKDAREYRTVDALDAFNYLKTKDFVDDDNIFLMGQSNGGSVAINVANSSRPGLGFRAVVAYYPWCGAFGSRKVDLSSPLLVLGGAKDDWVPPQSCNKVVSLGEELRVIIYPEAAHSFDVNMLPQRYLGKLVGYNKSAAENSRVTMLDFFNDHLSSKAKQRTVQQKVVKLSEAGTQ